VDKDEDNILIHEIVGSVLTSIPIIDPTMDIEQHGEPRAAAPQLLCFLDSSKMDACKYKTELEG
jgi:hypothetical protein